MSARPSVDEAGFAEALESKRSLLGSDVVFLGVPTVTWPTGTAINPDTEAPYDPMVEPVSSGQSSAVVRCGVFFKAVNRGGAAGADLESAIGFDEKTRIFAIAPLSEEPTISAAKTMIFHGDQFQIQAVKRDEIITGYQRLLIYAAAEG